MPSYVEKITQPLVEVLSHVAGLPVYQLAGHVANLDFWIAETKHALGLIDGYPQRFSDMVAGQQAYDARTTDAARARADFDWQDKPLSPTLTPAIRERLRNQLIKSAHRLLDRCLSESLIDLTRADELRESLTSPPSAVS